MARRRWASSSIPIPGANIVATDAQIRKILPSIEATLPHGVRVNVAMDRSQSVNAAVDDTERTLAIAVVLVIAVVFVFLQSARSIWIPAVALPLSIIGTFGPMYLMGYSIDNLSLMALTIGTGFVVDDAVVVLENIVRHLDSGLAPREAALRGSAEVGFTVVSMSLSLIAVFIPILLMPGIVGLRVPRIRGDAVDRHPDLDGDLAHHNALHVRLHAQGPDANRLPGRAGPSGRSASSIGSSRPMRAGCMPCSTIRCWSGSC